MIKTKNETTVILCCGDQGCPEVERLSDGRYKVTDDDGNTVIVKEEELKLMGEVANKLGNDGEQLILG